MLEIYFQAKHLTGCEENNLGDLVVIASEIPKSAISIVECMDEFELQQIFARMKGIKEGEFIDFTPDKVKGKPKVAELSTIIENSSNIEELNNTYNQYKKEILEKLANKRAQIKKEYGIISINELKEKLEIKKRELLETKKYILERKYLKKDGISSQYSLKYILEELENKKLKEHLLETDRNIIEDNLQYQSETHGVSHTRRVNFLATIIMNSENVNSKTKKIIEIIVKNHDIGRTNDIEDKEHGRKSVNLLENNEERLDTLSDEQKEIVKFVIKEHSLSARENTENLNHIFETKIQEKMAKTPSWMMQKGMEPKIKNRISKELERDKKYVQKILEICKDADKLDRVRLDPLGENPREGLDASRLSLDSSKTFENIAYESFDKILEILDIEHELVDTNKKIYEIEELIALESEEAQFELFEERMKSAKLNEDAKKKRILNSIISDRGFNKISDIPMKIKNFFLQKNTERKR